MFPSPPHRHMHLKQTLQQELLECWGWCSGGTSGNTVSKLPQDAELVSGYSRGSV